MGVLGGVFLLKSGLRILIQAPKVPFLYPQNSQKQPKWPILSFLGDQKSDFQQFFSVRWISELFWALKNVQKSLKMLKSQIPIWLCSDQKNINVLFLPKCNHSISNYLPHLEHFRVIALSIFRIQKLPLAANRLKNQMLR